MQGAGQLHEAGGLQVYSATFDLGEVALGNADSFTQSSLGEAFVPSGDAQAGSNGHQFRRAHMLKYLSFHIYILSHMHEADASGASDRREGPALFCRSYGEFISGLAV